MKPAGMRSLIFINTLMASAWDFHAFMVPVLGHERGLAASQIGIILGVFALCATLIRLVTPLLSPRLKDWMLMTLAVGISGVALAAYPFSPSPLVMGVYSGLLGMALGSVQPHVLGMLHQMAPAHRRGEALALRLVFSNASALSLPVLAGAAAGVMGTNGLFLIAGAVVTAGSLAGLKLRHLGRDKPSRS